MTSSYGIQEILLTIFLDGRKPLEWVATALGIVGLWMIFKKCGAAGWHALIPGWRYVMIGRCCGREPEGVETAVAWLLATTLDVLDLLIPVNSLAREFMLAIAVAVNLFRIVEVIRLMLGMTELFGRRKRWIILWIVAEFLPFFIWGVCKKYRPRWKLEDLKEQSDDFFSGAAAEVLEKGLTVNLRERTVREYFKRITLLKDIHLDIEPNSMVLLLGGSGAGKTTLLNAIIGYEKAKASIMLNDTDVYKNYDQMKYNIGFVPQQDLMRENDTVEHTLRDAAALRLPVTLDRQTRTDRVEEVMEIFGLLPVRDSMVVKLSGGQRKRLSIAIEMLSNPDLFILDEPDSGLDGVMARELMQQLRSIADQGKIVVVITHTPDRCADLFDKVIVLAKDAARIGRLAFYGPLQEARSFFGRETMEKVVKCINRQEEGGDGMADEYIRRFAEVQNG